VNVFLIPSWYPDPARGLMGGVFLAEAAQALSRHVPVPPALDDIVARCLARDPQNRFPDVAVLDEALRKVAGAGLARPSPMPGRAETHERVTTAWQVPAASRTGLAGTAISGPFAEDIESPEGLMPRIFRPIRARTEVDGWTASGSRG